MTKRYDAVISRKDRDGKVRYTKIGSAFPAKEGKDGFNIVLDALPMPNPEGQAWISLYVPKPRDEQGSASRPDARNGDMNDDIPFAPEFR